MIAMMSAPVVRLLRALRVQGYGLAALSLATALVGAGPAVGVVLGAVVAPQISVAADRGKGHDDDDDDDDDDKFPQPVRVGDLIGRDVVAPQESQNLIGHVRKLVRDKDGDLQLVMTYGGYFGSSVGSHLVCVALDDLALTGVMIQAKDIDPGDLAKLPTCDGRNGMALDADEVIKVNLAKPAH